MSRAKCIHLMIDREKSCETSPLKYSSFVIDETSIISTVLFYQVHQRLNEIFGCPTELPFPGLPVLVCGDLYQLPPVKGALIYYCRGC